MKRILVTGSGGQLGSQFGLVCPQATTLLLDRQLLDVADAGAVSEAVGTFAPDLVIHTAAMTNVDECESVWGRDLAREVNAAGAENVARACSNVGATMVYISTNYVFDGKKIEPYNEDDTTNPLNVYGATKLQGETAVVNLLEEHYVVRTSTLYGANTSNFVTSFLGAASKSQLLNYVNDQRVVPTSTADLAIAIMDLIEAGTFGIYHLVNEGEATWYCWARQIMNLAGIRSVTINPISASEFERPAAIPRNGVIANNKARKLGVQLRCWKEALSEYMSGL